MYRRINRIQLELRAVLHTHMHTGEHRMFYKPRGSDFLHKKVRPDGQSIPTGYPSFWALSSLANTVPVFKNETVDWNGVPIEDQPEPCVVKSKIGLGHPWLKDKDGEWTDWCFC